MTKRQNERKQIIKDLMKDSDAFIILTKQGVVLASDDARITQKEDKYLYSLNRRLIARKKVNVTT